MTDQPAGLSGIAKHHLAIARAELARLDLCGHGVDRTRGKCTDCEPKTTTEETA